MIYLIHSPLEGLFLQCTEVKDTDKSLMKRVTTTLMMLFFINACSTYTFPGVHRITVQQGNVVTQVMIDKLKPGMTKSQVHYVLGTTVIDDALNQDRWDYIYTIQIPGTAVIQKKLQIHFVDGRLSHFDGDYVPTGSGDDAEEAESEG